MPAIKINLAALQKIYGMTSVKKVSKENQKSEESFITNPLSSIETLSRCRCDIANSLFRIHHFHSDLSVVPTVTRLERHCYGQWKGTFHMAGVLYAENTADQLLRS